MKEIIEAKIAALDAQRTKMETIHLYYLKPAWKELTAKINVLREVLKEADPLRTDDYKVGY